MRSVSTGMMTMGGSCAFYERDLFILFMSLIAHFLLFVSLSLFEDKYLLARAWSLLVSIRACSCFILGPLLEDKQEFKCGGFDKHVFTV